MVVVVHSTPQWDFNGDLFIEPSLCLQTKREYEIIQSIINIMDGYCQIIIKGVSAEGLLLDKDNRIEEDLDGANNSLIDETMIHVNGNIGTTNKLNLIIIIHLNEYRDCFAFSVRELGC